MKLSLNELDTIFVALKSYTMKLTGEKRDLEKLTSKIYFFSNEQKKKLIMNVEMEKDEQK